MKKALKVVGIAIGALVALVLLLVLTLPIWLGPVVKPVANTLVPSFTKTGFRLGHLSLNPYSGRFELGDLVLANPEGYPEPTAVALSNLVVDVAMDTLGDEYVHVEEVTVEDLFVSLVKGGPNDIDNFLQIQWNVAGGKEKYEEKQAEGKARKEAKAQLSAEAEKAAEAAEKAKLEKMSAEERAEYEAKKEIEAEAEELASKKLVIDRLTIKGIRLRYGMMTLPVPAITLTDLGKKSDGLTMVEMWDSVWQAILKSALAVGDGAKALGALLGDGAGALGESAGKAADALGDHAKALGDRAKALGEGAGKAADAVGEHAGKALDAVKGLFK